MRDYLTILMNPSYGSLVTKNNLEKISPVAKKNKHIPIVIMTNDRNPIKANLMFSLYNTVKAGRLGYMDGMDPDTGDIVPMLVGIEPSPDGTVHANNVYPLAILVRSDYESFKYWIPDGAGNYCKRDGTPASMKEEENNETVLEQFGERNELGGVVSGDSTEEIVEVRKAPRKKAKRAAEG